MNALDLTQAPPRGPRARLPGLDLVILARTVDKLRATLPGGNLGAYKIEGFSSRLLETLGIDEGQIRAAVAAAADDAEIAAWVRERTDPQRYPAINARMESLTIADRVTDPAWAANNPLALTLPPETTRFDYLELDDAALFKGKV